MVSGRNSELRAWGETSANGVNGGGLVVKLILVAFLHPIVRPVSLHQRAHPDSHAVATARRSYVIPTGPQDVVTHR